MAQLLGKKDSPLKTVEAVADTQNLVVALLRELQDQRNTSEQLRISNQLLQKKCHDQSMAMVVHISEVVSLRESNARLQSKIKPLHLEVARLTLQNQKCKSEKKAAHIRQTCLREQNNFLIARSTNQNLVGAYKTPQADDIEVHKGGLRNGDRPRQQQDDRGGS